VRGGLRPKRVLALRRARAEPLVLAGQVKAPVFLEVAVADHGAQGEDGLGAVQAPSCSADVEPVADQVSAGLSQARRLLGGLAPPRPDGAALRAWSDPGWIKVAMEFRLELIRQAPC
jgi:hypothetical protein